MTRKTIIINNLILLISWLLLGFEFYFVFISGLFQIMIAVAGYMWNTSFHILNKNITRKNRTFYRLYRLFINSLALVFLIAWSAGILLFIGLYFYQFSIGNNGNISILNTYIYQLAGGFMFLFWVSREVLASWRSKSVDVGRPFVAIFCSGFFIAILYELGLQQQAIMAIVAVLCFTVTDFLILWINKNK